MDKTVDANALFPDLAGMTPVVPHQVSYPGPDYTIWKVRGITGDQRLQIINDDDFPRAELLENLGIAGFDLARTLGLSDRDEIIGRLSVMRFLLDNPTIATAIRELELSKVSTIPNSSNEFLDYFDDQQAHNPFWRKIIQLIELVDAAADVPPRMRTFIETLRQGCALEADEHTMAEVVKAQLFRTAVMEGIGDATIVFAAEVRVEAPDGFRLVGKDEVLKEGRHIKMDLKNNCSWVEMDAGEKELAEEGELVTSFMRTPVTCQLSETDVFGHRLYSSSLLDANRVQVPKWASRWWARFLGLQDGAKRKARRKRDSRVHKAMQQMTIEAASCELQTDLMAALKQQLNLLDWNELKAAIGYVADSKTVLKVEFCFTYGENGLRMTINRVFPKIAQHTSPFTHADYSGFGATRQNMIKQAIAIVTSRLTDIERSSLAEQFRQAAVRQVSTLYSTYTAASPNTDLDNRWFAVDNLLAVNGLLEVSSASKTIRAFAVDHFSRLKAVEQLLAQFIKKATELKTTLCVPEILGDDAHVVDFDGLFPMHLAFQEGEKPVAITTLPSINGQIIGLSGFHGGGKSVTELTLATAIYLAQSGLPVFAKHFSLNVKTTVGLVFIANGHVEGSTCELLVRKTGLILKAAFATPANRMIVLLDELGGGTQEANGLDFGKRVLQTLATRKVSTVFSTQILDLHRFAETKLNARCFKFDRKHRITTGIGGGDLEGLVAREGLSKYLTEVEN